MHAGFHQSRYGYKTLKEIETVVAKYKEAGLPLESMWSDIDYMDRYMDFTVDPDTYPPVKLRKFIDTLHANHQKFMMIVDPGSPSEHLLLDLIVQIAQVFNLILSIAGRTDLRFLRYQN